MTGRGFILMSMKVFPMKPFGSWYSLIDPSNSWQLRPLIACGQISSDTQTRREFFIFIFRRNLGSVSPRTVQLTFLRHPREPLELTWAENFWTLVDKIRGIFPELSWTLSLEWKLGSDVCDRFASGALKKLAMSKCCITFLLQGKLIIY